ncbi:MAG: asparaginase domain-containing protein [Pseudomonadota bacterium]
MSAASDTTSIAVFDTGGTINGILSESDPVPTRSLVIDYLREHSARYAISISNAEQIVMKDSRVLTSTDRDALLTAIQIEPCNRILVPHGTFTMPQTGEYLQQRLGRNHKRCVVLVGARKPLNDPDTDAYERLTFAISALRDGLPGVWIAMGDKLWPPSKVKKNLETGEFVAR